MTFLLSILAVWLFTSFQMWLALAFEDDIDAAIEGLASLAGVQRWVVLLMLPGLALFTIMALGDDNPEAPRLSDLKKAWSLVWRGHV